MSKQYWLDLFTDYVTAYRRNWPAQPVKRESLNIAMSVAEFETRNANAWPGTNNFGAVQLRKLTADEEAHFNGGALKAGDTFPGNPGGVLHVDTHPTAAGPQPYPVWFAAFPTRVDGIAYFLRTLWHLSKGAPDADGATCASVAKAMYLGGYFEGSHAGARPVGKRVDPLTAPELANIADYAQRTGLIYPNADAATADWMPDGKGAAALARDALLGFRLDDERETLPPPEET